MTLAPDGFLVPASTLRVLLRRGSALPMRYVGFALSPSVPHGAELLVRAGATPNHGDLILCDAEGWPDLRRVVAVEPSGKVLTAIDTLPRARATVDPAQVLAVVQDGAHGLGRIISVYPAWSRLAGLWYWFLKIGQAPDMFDDGVASIAGKYKPQVESYTKILEVPLGDWTLDLVRRHVAPGGCILVPGSGSGREALHLARAGYRVTGIDIVSEMVAAARQSAREAGLNATFLQADMAELDLPGQRFDGVYVTPLVYSFVPGRARRLECLRRLGRHLAVGGAVIYSAHLVRSPEHLLRVLIVHLRRRLKGNRTAEFGDWFTWFLTPEGAIGKAFSHRFLESQMQEEARAAGYRTLQPVGSAHFVAKDYHDESLGSA